MELLSAHIPQNACGSTKATMRCGRRALWKACPGSHLAALIGCASKATTPTLNWLDVSNITYIYTCFIQQNMLHSLCNDGIKQTKNVETATKTLISFTKNCVEPRC